MIKVQNLTKKYGNIVAIDNISFQVNKGEILGFLGPNGAGKTTTMRMITGYMPASEGRVEVSGFDIADDPIAAKNEIGYLPENPPLYDDMKVTDFLDFVAGIKGVVRRGSGSSIAIRALARSLPHTGLYEWLGN